MVGQSPETKMSAPETRRRTQAKKEAVKSSSEETSSSERTTSTEQTSTESSERTTGSDRTMGSREAEGTARMAGIEAVRSVEGSKRSEERKSPRRETQLRTSVTGTVVNRASSRRGAGSVASSNSSQRRAALAARLELEQRQKEKADAALAIAKTKMELIQLELEDDSSDISEVDNDDLVSEWVNKSAQEEPVRERERSPPRKIKEPEGEVANLATAIMSAINSAKSSSSAPRYINDLHQFDGNPREWIAFKATYRDTSNYFSDMENVARLRKAVQGQARESVKSLLYTNTRPREIMEALERRFGRPTHLIKSEIAAISKLPVMSNDIKGIGLFASAIANSVNTIKQMNRNDYLYSSEISERIIDKMNMMVKFRWYEYRSAHEERPVLLALSAFLNDIADQFEAYDTSSTEYWKVKKEFPKGRPFKSRVHTARCKPVESDSESDDGWENDYEGDSEFERERDSAIGETRTKDDIVLTATVGKSKEIGCLMCKKEHELVKCPQFEKEAVKDRWETVKKLKVCFKCLKTNHRHINCRAKPCGKGDCKKQHHHMLHEVVKRDEQKIVSVNHVNATKAYLKIVPVELSGPNGTETVAALLDEGSTVTLLLDEIANKIGADGPAEELSIEGVGGQRMTTTNSRQLKVRVKGLLTRHYEQMSAYTIDRLNLAPQTVRKEDLEGCEHLEDIQDQVIYERMKPSLLIGQDNWHLIVTRKLKSGDLNQPVASFTKLGWILHGCRSEAPKPVKFINHVHRAEESIDDLIKAHFSIESLGVTSRKPKNDPEERALAILEKTTKKLPEGRYECGLLWQHDDEVMPKNRESAVRRLKGIENKMSKNEKFKIQYNEQIANLINSGYAEKICTAPTSPRTWYLPHFAVVHPQKGKMRLVFDAAERTNGKSLNDALLSGPDLLQSLFGVLLRFRCGRVAVAADIKEMFLRIAIREKDRDSLRFLWRGDITEPIQEYRMTSLIFGATSSPCSAIFVKDFNARDSEESHPEAVYAIKKCHYMDDYLQSFGTIAEAIKTAEEVDRIHKQGGFELRGWASNHPQVIANLTKDVPTDQVHIGHDEQTERTLGMLWRVKSDTLKYTVNLRNTPADIISGEKPPTKRQVTSAVMSVFDPIGLASPITIQGKKIIQQLWRAGTDWDEPIPDALTKEWNTWMLNLTSLQSLELPRWANSQDEGELHTFVDASEGAYAAAVYWRANRDNDIQTNLVAAKARVTPLKPVSIPRLELQAAVLGCRLAASVQREIPAKVIKRYFWSDSRTVLAWIKSDPRTFKPFVAHRLAEIEEESKSSEWRWVPTSENVADDATRSAPKAFNKNHRWFHGPEFLRKNQGQWPIDRSNPTITPSTGEEKIKTVAVLRKLEIPIPNVNRFSSWNRLLRSTARIFQCIDKFKSLLKNKENVAAIKKTVSDPSWRKYNRKIHKTSPAACTPKIAVKYVPLPVEYITQAENALIKCIQMDAWQNEIKILQSGLTIDNKTSKLKRLSLKLKNNIIYLETRLSSTVCIPEDYREPVVLYGKHPITKLLVKHYHQLYNHGNHNTVMNELRQKYYITSLRNLIKYITRTCDWCRTRKAMPAQAPTGNLPPERLQRNQPPFTCTGVDYFGPMSITIGRRPEKRWVALYTCLTTRAVHLEVVPSLSADSMILSLRRMSARRGTPRVIYSDNGTNFIKANKELQAEIEKMINKTEAKGIQWKFIPAGAPNMGGAWERLVRSIKVALTATMKDRQPREEILHTLLLEAEHLVNSRPLSDVSLDPDDEETLTPNHFLLGRSSGNNNVGDFDDSALVGPATWKTVQRLADKFWSRWVTEYLPTITPRYNTGNKSFCNLQVNDVVIIIDSSLPRGTWPRGQITRIYPGPDGKVRIVDVRTTAGELRRPASRIIKIA